MGFAPIAAKRAWHFVYRKTVRLRCAWTDRLDRWRRTNALGCYPPALLRFRVNETTSLARFISVGEATAANLVNALRTLGRNTNEFRCILDFGCGCGRSLLWLKGAVPGARVVGTDIDAEAIGWCRQHVKDVEFWVSDRLPPLPCADSTFDLLYAVSVFTHISHEDQLQWLTEFRRILKPGGLGLLTIHGAEALRVLDAGEAEALKQTGFLFCTSRKLKGIVPDWYQTAFHTPEHVMRTWSKAITVTQYLPGAMGAQDLVIVQP